MPVKKKSELIKEILLCNKEYSLLTEYNEETDKANSKEELDKNTKIKNICTALNVNNSIKADYKKINPFFRFFSHFVPNSWTETGRMRNEMKACENAFKEVGFDDEEMSAYYNEIRDDDVQSTQVVDRIRKKHWFNRTFENDMKEITAKESIGETIDINTDNLDDSIDEEHIEQIEVNLNDKQGEVLENNETNNENINFEGQELEKK